MSPAFRRWRLLLKTLFVLIIAALVMFVAAVYTDLSRRK